MTEKYVPEWEKPCWITAIRKTLGTSEERIKELAKKVGWDGQAFGLSISHTIQVAWDLIGKMPDLSLTKEAQGMTPKAFSGSKTTQAKTGLVFTKNHVMPMVKGVLSNYNGHGDEQIVVVATYET